MNNTHIRFLDTDKPACIDDLVSITQNSLTRQRKTLKSMQYIMRFLKVNREVIEKTPMHYKKFVNMCTERKIRINKVGGMTYLKYDGTEVLVSYGASVQYEIVERSESIMTNVQQSIASTERLLSHDSDDLVKLVSVYEELRLAINKFKAEENKDAFKECSVIPAAFYDLVFNNGRQNYEL